MSLSRGAAADASRLQAVSRSGHGVSSTTAFMKLGAFQTLRAFHPFAEDRLRRSSPQ